VEDGALLVLMRQTPAGVFVGELEGPEIITDPAQLPQSFREAPALAELVKAGKLPPVNGRIGDGPLVVKPLHDIGQYGGTWRRGFTGPADSSAGQRVNEGVVKLTVPLLISRLVWHTRPMHTSPTTNPYKHHRFPAELISHCVWLYFRLCLSYRDVEGLMAERGVILTYEAVRYWCRKVGQAYANQLRRHRP
jgi:hypothetical protein